MEPIAQIVLPPPPLHEEGSGLCIRVAPSILLSLIESSFNVIPVLLPTEQEIATTTLKNQEGLGHQGPQPN